MSAEQIIVFIVGPALVTAVCWGQWRIEGAKAAAKAERHMRQIRATEPGPRYAARKIGTSLMFVGDRAVTREEAEQYVAEHPGWEVVTCEVRQTAWQNISEVVA